MSFEPHTASELEPESDAARARWAREATAHAARLRADRKGEARQDAGRSGDDEKE